VLGVEDEVVGHEGVIGGEHVFVLAVHELRLLLVHLETLEQQFVLGLPLVLRHRPKLYIEQRVIQLGQRIFFYACTVVRYFEFLVEHFRLIGLSTPVVRQSLN